MSSAGGLITTTSVESDRVAPRAGAAAADTIQKPAGRTLRRGRAAEMTDKNVR